MTARDDRREFSQGQPIRTVEDDDVDGASRGRQGGDHRGNRHEDGQQVSHERVGDEEIEIAGSLPVGQDSSQLLVLARTRSKGVRANTPHARDGLRD